MISVDSTSTDSSNVPSERKPSLFRRRGLWLIVGGLFVLGSGGYWLASWHPTPTGPIAAQLGDRTWQFQYGTRPWNLRLNADGTCTLNSSIGPPDEGTWNIVDGLFYMEIKPTGRPWWMQARINLQGGSEVWYRIVHLTEDDLTLERLTQDRKKDPTESDLECRRIDE